MGAPYTYDPTIPNPPNDPADDVFVMQTNSQSIFNIMKVDHIGFGSNQGGFHNLMHFITQTSDPVATNPFGQLYTFIPTTPVGQTDAQLFYQSPMGVKTQLTGKSTFTMNGFIQLGALTIQWGQALCASNALTTVTFPTPFSATVFSVVAIMQRNENSNVDVLYIDPASITSPMGKTDFGIHNTSSSNRNSCWIAIGPT